MTVTPIKGYKVQPQEVLDLVNDNKIHEERLLRRLDDILTHQRAYGGEFDPRAFSIAKTKFQEAFMWFNRGLMNPDRINLPEDN